MCSQLPSATLGDNGKCQVSSIGDDAVNTKVKQRSHAVWIIDGPDMHLDAGVMECRDRAGRDGRNAQRPLRNLHGVDPDQRATNGT